MAVTAPWRPRTTTDLIIRPFTAADIDAAHAALDLDQDEPGVSRHERAAMLIYRVRQLDMDEGIGCYAIEHRSSHALIGYVGLQFHLLPGALHATPEIELFYKLAKSFAGRGYATQACRSMLEFAFDGLHLERTVSVTERDNVRSVALLERLGATIVDHPTRAGLVVGVIESSRHKSGE